MGKHPSACSDTLHVCQTEVQTQSKYTTIYTLACTHHKMYRKWYMQRREMMLSSQTDALKREPQSIIMSTVYYLPLTLSYSLNNRLVAHASIADTRYNVRQYSGEGGCWYNRHTNTLLNVQSARTDYRSVLGDLWHP